MTYEDWLETVPTEFTDDPLWKMEVYRLALFLADQPFRGLWDAVHPTHLPGRVALNLPGIHRPG
jgi:hypothetical protein